VIALSLASLCLIAALVYEKRQNSLREKEWSLERAALLQRIQAPEVAVYENARRERKPAQVVPYDDDAAFWAAKEGVNGDGA
jgi:hypothetical protein